MRFSLLRGGACAPRARRPHRLFSPRLESLEDRQLLTVVAAAPDLPAGLDSTTGEGSVATALAAPAVTATPLVEATDGAPILYRHGTVIASFVPDTDTDVDRGLALRSALAAAQPGDQIVLAAAIYDMGGDEHVEFPDGVTVTGAGKTATKLTSSCPIQTDPNASFTLNNQTTLEDLWLEGSLHNGYYQTLVGMAGAPTEDVTTYLRRVKITGDSDGIFIWTAQQYQYTLQAFDCDINTNYDAVALLGSSPNRQTVQMWNCNITAAQPSAIPHYNSNAVNVASGLAQLYDCTLTASGDPSALIINGALAWNLGQIELRGCTVNTSAPPSAISDFDLTIQDAGKIYVTGGQGSGPNGTYTSSTGTEVYQNPIQPMIGSHGLFYNNSAFDDYDPLAGADDDNAMAVDKTALRPGDGTATFANISSYTSGINGVTVDLSGEHGNISADDFTFRIGRDNSPSNWIAAPAPLSVELFGGAGAFGSDRVRITWADGAITNTWLEISLLADSNTGLAHDDVFYFGSAIADSGTGNTDGCLVNVVDEFAVRRDFHGNADLVDASDPNDFNRDQVVNAIDQIAVRNNATSRPTELVFINIDPPGAPALATIGTTEATISATTAAAPQALDASAAEPDSALAIMPSSLAAIGPAGRVDRGSTGFGLSDWAPVSATSNASSLRTRPAEAPVDATSNASRLQRGAALAATLDWLDSCLELP
jgi:hypothetical protein